MSIPFYTPANKKIWTGRKSELREYWHQSIKCINLEMDDPTGDVVILGYKCDEGVRRNQGRVGTINGPDAIRKVLGKLPLHSDKKLLDAGDFILSQAEDLETYQLGFSKEIERLLRNKLFPVVLGGGHDMSYAHFCGIYNAFSSNEKRFGIINFDAHFDLRSEVQATSGTPFYQILEEFGERVKYQVLGIQESSNTKELFETAKKTGSRYLLLEDCSNDAIEKTYALLDELLSTVDHLYITVDMDGFSSAFSPGVSAPSPFGLWPEYVSTVLDYLFKSQKVVAIDFAETNPEYDIDNTTARLAAKLIWQVVNKGI